jgi:hypothetical protein
MPNAVSTANTLIASVPWVSCWMPFHIPKQAGIAPQAAKMAPPIEPWRTPPWPSAAMTMPVAITPNAINAGSLLSATGAMPRS